MRALGPETKFGPLRICSRGHDPIMVRTDPCPLCQALRRLEAARETVQAQCGACSRRALVLVALADWRPPEGPAP
jgi:hypothetical protein